MELVRYRLALGGPFGTPLTSGTLFGELCWALVRRDGDDKRLVARLARLRDEPFLISDALPEDHLPRPLLPPDPTPPARDRADAHKRLKRRRWLRRELFLKRQLTPDEDDPAEPMEHRAAHGRIDRIRGTTPESGGLYFVDEWWPKLSADRPGPASDRVDVYVRSSWPIDEIADLLSAVGAWGHGRDSTWGRGRFRLEGYGPDRELDRCSGARRLSLSHGARSANMQDARWKVWTHFGKVGAEVTARGGRPWKRPVLLLRPGATWRPADDAPAGAWLTEGLYQDADKVGMTIGLNAFHLSVAYDDPSSQPQAA